MLIAGTVNLCILLLAAANLAGCRGHRHLEGAYAALERRPRPARRDPLRGRPARVRPRLDVGRRLRRRRDHARPAARPRAAARPPARHADPRARRSSGIGFDPTLALVLSQVVLSFGIPFALIPLVALTAQSATCSAIPQPLCDDRRGHRGIRLPHRAQRRPALARAHRRVSATARRYPEPVASSAVDDYLKTIYAHTEWQTDRITPSQLAAELGLAPSSVTEMVQKLAAQGLVTHRPYGPIALSDGRRGPRGGDHPPPPPDRDLARARVRLRLGRGARRGRGARARDQRPAARGHRRTARAAAVRSARRRDPGCRGPRRPRTLRAARRASPAMPDACCGSATATRAAAGDRGGRRRRSAPR